MKQRLSLAKILKFARDSGFAYNQIYKIRGEVRFIILSLGRGNGDKIVIEIPIQHSVIIKTKDIENVATLRPTEQNMKHIDYWSFLNPNMTENCLFCRGSKDITIFKDNGEVKSYSLFIEEDLVDEDSDDDDKYNREGNSKEKEEEKPISRLEETINKLLKKAEEEEKKAEKEKEFSSKIIFKDESGKEISKGNIDEKYIPEITPLEDLKDEDFDQEYSDIEESDSDSSSDSSDSESSDSEEEEKGGKKRKKHNKSLKGKISKEKGRNEEEEEILKEKLGELYKLDSEAELDLGEFYLMITLTEFYQHLNTVKDKLKKFSSEFMDEEENIRRSRLENLLIALSSLNPTIQNFFDSYSAKEKEFKTQINKIIPLYERIKELPEYDNNKKTSARAKRVNIAKEKLKGQLPELREIIHIKKKEINYIRDILNVALGKLEQDVEKITSRCIVTEIEGEEEDDKTEEEHEEEEDNLEEKKNKGDTSRENDKDNKEK